MFTGLIKEIGVIKAIKKGSLSAQLTIKASKVLENMTLGDSIATNGVCLTVISFTTNEFVVDVMPETMRLSNLNDLVAGSLVNLEPALRLGDRFGGHIVSGHSDGVGKIVEITKEDNATWIKIEIEKQLLKYIVYKGSVAIDGTSLTIGQINEDSFKVSIIPLTKEETTLLKKKIGDDVNIECDVIGKYVEKLVTYVEPKTSKKTIDINFLTKNGFL